MGKHKLEHRQTRIHTTSPIMLEVTIVETWRQLAEIDIIQSLDVGITTTCVEMFVAPTVFWDTFGNIMA